MIPGVIAGAGIGAAANVLTSGINNIANAVEARKTREFNAEQAEENRKFQREMAQNNIKYAVQQAKDLGISPSLVLGDQTKQLGGSQASGVAAHYETSGITSGINSVINAMIENQRLKTQEEMQENKLQATKEMQDNKIKALKEMQEDRLQARVNDNKNNKATQYEQRKYSKEYLNSLYDNLDDLKV